MINPTTYTSAWIASFKQQKQYRAVNNALFEKMIYAFSLLESLAATGFEFIFKGGTSLLLMPVNSDRFSIDIDIITNKSKAELELVLDKIINDSVFSAWHEDKDRHNKGGIPKAHYVFDFDPKANKNGTILLDVLFENNPYKTITRTEIRNSFIDTSEPWLTVNIPSIDSILGDKLTAFAPTTIGVPYWLGNPEIPDKRIEIIKQLHDNSILIDHFSDPQEVKDVFWAIAEKQLLYRSLNATVEDVITDIFSTALIIAKRDRNSVEPDISKFADIQTGLIMFGEYLITGSFKIEDAIGASAKVAYFTQSFIHRHQKPFTLYNTAINLENLIIGNLEYNFLNRFKKTNKPAFFYWYSCLEMMNLID